MLLPHPYRTPPRQAPVSRGYHRGVCSLPCPVLLKCRPALPTSCQVAMRYCWNHKPHPLFVAPSHLLLALQWDSTLLPRHATPRFNPNLYADGKICLSILGTWRGTYPLPAHKARAPLPWPATFVPSLVGTSFVRERLHAPRWTCCPAPPGCARLDFHASAVPRLLS